LYLKRRGKLKGKVVAASSEGGEVKKKPSENMSPETIRRIPSEQVTPKHSKRIFEKGGKKAS